MLNRDEVLLVLVDVQGKLAEIMHDKDSLYAGVVKLVQGIRTLKMPVIWTEQIPEKMGPTIPQVASLLGGLNPIAKTSFGCCGEPAFVQALETAGRKTVLIAGIEAHVCVYQTALELQERGFKVEIVGDAVSSRTSVNKEIALRRLAGKGIGITSVEMLIFELLKTSTAPEFREILRIVK